MKFKPMKKLLLLVSLPLFCFSQTEIFLSLPKQKSFFQKTENLYSDFNGARIQVHPEQQFQSMDGFGFTLTGGSAQLIQQLEPSKRAALLQDLFGKDGISVLRIGVGATDLDASVFSYEDKPRKFSLEP
ncbi:MAG: hypothetical protein RI950_791, partial [Bacteroidota bacterium]